MLNFPLYPETPLLRIYYDRGKVPIYARYSVNISRFKFGKMTLNIAFTRNNLFKALRKLKAV